MVLDVGGDGVEAFLVAFHGCAKVLGGVVFCAFAAAPHDEGGGAEFSGEVDIAQDFAQAEASDGAVVVGQATVFEDGVAEGVGGDHFNDEAGIVGCGFEAGDTVGAFSVGGVEVVDVIVVEGDAPCAEFGEFFGVFPGVKGGACCAAEGVCCGPSNGPEAEGELLVVGGGHGFCLSLWGYTDQNMQIFSLHFLYCAFLFRAFPCFSSRRV